MKKLLAILLVCLMTAALFVGCAAPAKTPNDEGTGTPTTNETDSGTEQKDASDLRVVVVVTDALGGGGTPDDMNNYLKQAVTDFGVNGQTYEATDPAQYEEVLRTFAREGVDMIITAFPQMVEPVTNVAAEFPDVKFSILLPLTLIDRPNVKCIEFACWELYYLAGMMAGYLTETNLVGHVLGAEQSALIANDNAYIEGLAAVNPDAKVLVINANSFTDPAAGKDVGLSLISQGCDVILTDCSNAASGVIEAGKENGVYVMADSGEHYPEAPEYVLGDTQCNYGAATYEQIRNLIEGTWTAEQYYTTLAASGISLALSPVIRDHLSPEMQARWDEGVAAIKAATEKIISGELVVEMDVEWAK